MKKTITLFLLPLFVFSQKINKRWVYNEICEQGCKFPDIVLAQAILESGNFKSSIFLKNNNIFGMKVSERRISTAIGKRKGYAKYLDWGYSVTDYLLFQEMIFTNKTYSRKEYLKMLDRIYCETPNYSKQILCILRSNNYIINMYNK